MNNIRANLTVGMLVICLAGMMLLMIVSYFIARSIIEEEALVHMKNLVSSEAEKSNNFLGLNKGVASAVGIALGSMESEDEIKAFLVQVAQSYSDISEIYVGFSDKNLILGSGYIPPTGFDPTGRPWYTRAMAANSSIVFSEPYIDIITGRMVITIAQYVGELNGLDAVYGIDLFVDRVTETVESVELPAGRYSFLIDASGLIVAHPEPLFAPSVENGLKPMQEIPVYADIYRQLQTDAAGVIKLTDYDNTVRYFAPRDIDIAGWTMIVAIPESAVMSPTNRLILWTIPLFAIMVVIVILFTSFYIRNVKAFVNEILQAERMANESDIAKGRAEAAREAIVSSLNYAYRIQSNMLPTTDDLDKAFSDHAIIWKPKDIVGGDIYWIKNFDQGSVLCVIDCTGHGTPGALLTMLVTSALEAIVGPHNCQDTAGIIWQLEQRLVTVFSIKSEEREKNIADIKDGCDLAVIFIAKDGSATLSAGNTNVFVCDGEEVRRIKGQKIYVGEGMLNSKDEIITVHIPAKSANKFYVASDGLFEQPGADQSLPFGYNRFSEIILRNHNENQSVISDMIWEAFEAYRGGKERVDDFELIMFSP